MPSCPDSFEAAPSTPSPTATPARSMSRTGAMPDASRAFEDGQCATPVPVAAYLSIAVSSRCTQCAIQTSLPSHPTDSRYCVGLMPNRSRQYASSSTVSEAWVCSRTSSERREHGRLAQQVGGHRERRARRDRDAHERIERGVVIALHGLGGCAERGIRRLHREVREGARPAKRRGPSSRGSRAGARRCAGRPRRSRRRCRPSPAGRCSGGRRPWCIPSGRAPPSRPRRRCP